MVPDLSPPEGVGVGVGVGFGVGVGLLVGLPLLPPHEEIVIVTPLSAASAAATVNSRRSRVCIRSSLDPSPQRTDPGAIRVPSCRSLWFSEMHAASAARAYETSNGVPTR